MDHLFFSIRSNLYRDVSKEEYDSKQKECEEIVNPIIQKLYSYFLNKETEISYPKHRYKKYIKDTVSGTIEREELILENLKIILKDEFNPSRTDLILKLMILSATFELMFVHKTPINVIVSEYVKISDFFLETAHKGYLNAILDKVSKNVRKKD